MQYESQRERVLVFDSSALIFARSILTYVQRDYKIVISPLISEESGISNGISIVNLEDSDRNFVYDCLKVVFCKDYAINYRKGRRIKHSGEVEAFALARRFDAPIVFHEKLIGLWAKMFKIEHIRLVDLPEKTASIPKQALLAFYDVLCKQRSSKKACDKYKEILQRK
jgi:hypothetical protein